MYWLDFSGRPAARPALGTSTRADLTVIGGGLCGLWTALLAKERDPGRDIVLVEADRIAAAASGRNGGFCAASLTHGSANGRAHFPTDFEALERLGKANLDEIEATVRSRGIGCHFERTGELSVAVEPYQVAELQNRDGFLDREAVQAELHSPTYLAGQWERESVALLDPARLCFGLASLAEQAGVRLFERTEVKSLEKERGSVVVRTPGGSVTSGTVAVATSAFRPLLRRLRLHVLPVYDYVLVTEPLSQEQLESLGWEHRQGIADVSNQFHYYRLTPDNRVLWGGYDAVYHFGRKLKASYEERPSTFDLLARQFFETFPQLEGLSFTHRWAGAIDTCTRFCAMFGTAFNERVAYALGFTGLGVGASRFAGNVMLDLLSGLSTERTELELVRRRPLPFPPEPLAYASVQLTRWSLARADRNMGKRNLWLRSLDRLGLGFDS